MDFNIIKRIYNLNLYQVGDEFIIFNKNYEGIRLIDKNAEFEYVLKEDKSNIKNEKNKCIIIENRDDISKVISNDLIGYVKFNYLNEVSNEEETLKLSEKREDFNGEINLMWTQENSYKNNSTFKKYNGINIISPTWLKLNVNGIVINESDFNYVKKAHNEDVFVWALINNSFNKKWTKEMLEDEELRKNTISQIVLYSSLYEFDGINLDFENIYLENKDELVVFVSELYSVLKEQGVVLSMDMTVPYGSDTWSKVYDRINLSKHLDYIFLMAYDEFWSSSKVSGPVSSIPWSDKGIKETLELVDNEKLILALPMYMRVWVENKNSVRSEAFGINRFNEVINKRDYNLVYDEENELNYYECVDDNIKYRIWAEDKLSLKKRFKLMDKYNIKGFGLWSEEFIDENVIEILNELK